jgi:peroxiredoxin
MVELGQLEAHHDEFAARHVRIVAASLDDVADTAQTQQKFPHLTIVSDAGEALAKAADVIGPQRSPTGGETVSPTTVLLDADGRARWVFRPDRYINRLSPQDLLAAIDKHLR